MGAGRSDVNLQETLNALDAAEAIAWAYGDTETAHRLEELMFEVRETHGEEGDDASDTGSG
jgi:hypothetical protein